MLKIIKKITGKIVYGEKASTERYIEHLKKIGVKIGEDVTIYSPIRTTIDEQYPWMISIGNHVRITEGVKILSHDYSWSVLKRYDYLGKKGVILGNAGKVEIGNNVFIGMNSIILGDVCIGDNVIIGAGSIVTKTIPENSVVAGTPARIIMSIDEYYEKRMKQQTVEARMLAREYKKRFMEFPKKEIFHEFFMLFSNDIQDADERFSNKMRLCSNYEESLEYLKRTTPMFENYEQFMKYCFEEEWD